MKVFIMARICLISLTSVQECPYGYKYKEKIYDSYDVISWKRGDEFFQDFGAEKEYVFSYKLDFDSSKIKKILAYTKYKNFLVKTIQQNRYEKLILLQTGIGILLSQLLIKEYKGKYILDIRDYFAERNRLIYAMENKVIENSKYTIISSEGYKNFLPPYPYIIVHNNQVFDYENYREKRKGIHGEPIRISFVGNMVYPKMQKKLLYALKNDERFILNYYGNGSERLEEFCKKEGIKNVRFYGKFQMHDILKFYKDCDIINNLYGNHTPALDYALSNKLYFAGELRKPIIVCPDTYMEELTRQYNMGYSLDIESEYIGDKLYAYYSNIDWLDLDYNCKKFMQKIYDENKEFDTIIGKYLEEGIE